MKPRPGFTLVEVVVVLLILSVSAAVVVPSFARPGDAMDLVVDRATRLLHDSRRLAVSRATRVRLGLEPDGRFHAWLLESDSGAALAEGRLPLPPEISLDSDRTLLLTFDLAGGAVGDSIPLRSGNQVRVLALDRWTGAVRDAHGR